MTWNTRSGKHKQTSVDPDPASTVVVWSGYVNFANLLATFDISLDCIISLSHSNQLHKGSANIFHLLNQNKEPLKLHLPEQLMTKRSSSSVLFVHCCQIDWFTNSDSIKLLSHLQVIPDSDRIWLLNYMYYYLKCFIFQSRRSQVDWFISLDLIKWWLVYKLFEIQRKY